MIILSKTTFRRYTVSIDTNVDLLRKRSFDFEKEKKSSKNNASGPSDLQHRFSKIFFLFQNRRIFSEEDLRSC